MAEATKQTKTLPKGGRKGGTRFPNINLQKALEYAKKLVSKTHSGPQPEQTILVGVFNNKGPVGGVRASALKQYGLMDGDAKGYAASELARDIEAAVPEQRPGLLQRAFLSSKVFKQVHDTLQSETASRARVRQVVINEDVHPDLADACVTCFIEGAVHAGLGVIEGENIVLANANTTASSAANPKDAEEIEAQETRQQYAATDGESRNSPNANEEAASHADQSGAAREASVRVNLTVDSSSDPEKLEKQLRLLRQYGLLR